MRKTLENVSLPTTHKTATSQTIIITPEKQLKLSRLGLENILEDLNAKPHGSAQGSRDINMAARVN